MKIVEFATEVAHLELPKPAKKYIPEWYRKAEKFVGGKPILNNENKIGSLTIKACAPFLDAYTIGYIVELSQDLQVKKGPTGDTILGWTIGELPVADIRFKKILQDYPIPSECTEEAWAWKFNYYFKTPPGYSILITHPMNRYDVPFITLSGVVDSDNTISNGNLPFFLKKDFEGIIPTGTPIAQIIPFKRDDWKSKENKALIAQGEKNTFLSRRVVSGWYKKNQWKRKDYS